MNLIQYFKESMAELNKVSWPTRSQAVRSTLIVLIFTIVAGVIIALVDYALTAGLKQLLFGGF